MVNEQKEEEQKDNGQRDKAIDTAPPLD